MLHVSTSDLHYKAIKYNSLLYLVHIYIYQLSKSPVSLRFVQSKISLFPYTLRLPMTTLITMVKIKLCLQLYTKSKLYL
jgi:hypothetical protein